MEERVIEGIKNLIENPQVPEEHEDEPENSYSDGDSDSGGSDYKSCGYPGEDKLVVSDWWGRNDEQSSETGPQRLRKRIVGPTQFRGMKSPG